MKSKRNIEDEWKADAPLLNGLKEKVSIEAPSGYFDQLNKSVMAKVNALDSQPSDVTEREMLDSILQGQSPKRPMQSYYWMLGSVAATIVVLIGLGLLIFRTQDAGNHVASHEIDGIVATQLATLSETEIAKALSVAKISDAELYGALSKHDAGQFRREADDWKIQKVENEIDMSDLERLNLDQLNIDVSDLY